jgi:aldose 1-epimerase
LADPSPAADEKKAARIGDMKIDNDTYGFTPGGQPVHRFTLTNSKGHSAQVMSWGASLLEVLVPDRRGKIENVNCVFNSLDRYLGKHPYFGSCVGRFANRIGNAKFTIDGKEHQLTVNHKSHQLHGGEHNFAFQNWQCESYQDASGVGVQFSFDSPDGDEGFPGNVHAVANYHWNESSELSLQFTATTDAATHVNLTNHSYWNLGGIGNGSILDHRLQMESDQFVDVDHDSIATGKINDVTGTPFDFRKATAIGERNDQLAETLGYDHCLVVRGEIGTLRQCARVSDPKSGRVLNVQTTQPGVQLYVGGHLPGGEASAGVNPNHAFCLETQHYPDAPNHASFPSTLLRPGDELNETTVFAFSAQ